MLASHMVMDAISSSGCPADPALRDVLEKQKRWLRGLVPCYSHGTPGSSARLLLLQSFVEWLPDGRLIHSSPTLILLFSDPLWVFSLLTPLSLPLPPCSSYILVDSVLTFLFLVFLCLFRLVHHLQLFVAYFYVWFLLLLRMGSAELWSSLPCHVHTVVDLLSQCKVQVLSAFHPSSLSRM